MVKNTTITLAAMSLLACNPVELFSGEPKDHYYLVGKAHRNAGPYVWDTEISLSDPSAVDQIAYVRSADASIDKNKALGQIREASEYITASLNELGQNDCVDESIVKVYFVPKKTLNDPKKMAFVTEESAFEENEFFGLNVSPTVLFSLVLSASFLVVSFLSPILSGIADYTGSKKKYLNSHKKYDVLKTSYLHHCKILYCRLEYCSLHLKN